MTIKKSITALAVAGAMVVGGLSFAQSATAAEIPGTITITPTSGNVNTDTYFISGDFSVSVGAPVGYQAASGTFVYQNGVEIGSIANMRTPSMPSTAGTNGLDGNPVFLHRQIVEANLFLTNKHLNATTQTLQTGPFELRYYYFSSSTSPNRATDPYVKLDMVYDATTGDWGLPAAPAITTTTSLSGGVTANPGEVSLSATVKDGAATATAAAGDIVFKEGATTVATVAVVNGTASALLTGVADGAHTYTAEFVSSDTVYAGSVSGTATVQVGGITEDSTINVTIPSNIGSLTLTGVSTSVELGTAALAGGTLNASGTLTAVVTDTRQLDLPAWSLTGQVGDFTATGGKVLEGKYLGWTPAVSGDAVSGPEASTAGAAVLPAPGSVDGLKAISAFANGQPNAAGTVTNASALLELKAPANTPAGDYSATLTLTLI